VAVLICQMNKCQNCGLCHLPSVSCGDGLQQKTFCSSFRRRRISPGKRHFLEIMTATQIFIYIPTFHVKRRPITMFAIPCIWTPHSFILIHLTSLHITSSIHFTSLHITSSIHLTSLHITALVFEFPQISIQAPKKLSHFSFR